MIRLVTRTGRAGPAAAGPRGPARTVTEQSWHSDSDSPVRRSLPVRRPRDSLQAPRLTVTSRLGCAISH
eukprot:9205-Hanusia_phi.AAC.1